MQISLDTNCTAGAGLCRRSAHVSHMSFGLYVRCVCVFVCLGGVRLPSAHVAHQRGDVHATYTRERELNLWHLIAPRERCCCYCCCVCHIIRRVLPRLLPFVCNMLSSHGDATTRTTPLHPRTLPPATRDHPAGLSAAFNGTRMQINKWGNAQRIADVSFSLRTSRGRGCVVCVCVYGLRYTAVPSTHKPRCECTLAPQSV